MLADTLFEIIPVIGLVKWELLPPNRSVIRTFSGGRVGLGGKGDFAAHSLGPGENGEVHQGLNP